MIEILKINETPDEFGVYKVAVFENNCVLAEASYVLYSDYLSIINFSCDCSDCFIADSLVKTLLFYADVAKIQFVRFDMHYEKYFIKYNYKIDGDSCVLNIFEQNFKCNCD